MDESHLKQRVIFVKMLNLPAFIGICFSITTLFCLLLFFKASNFNKGVIAVVITWTILQGAIAFTGFYSNTNVLPPRFLFAILPAVIAIGTLFITSGGKRFINTLELKWLTLLHLVRVPVELVLFWLFLNHTLPKVMTFEGWNLDFISGILALFVYYFGYVTKKLGAGILLILNLVGLCLLINIVTLAVLSTPFPFQKFGFEQPNIAVFYFPFIWLPTVVVPLVFFSHLVCIRQIILRIKK